MDPLFPSGKYSFFILNNYYKNFYYFKSKDLSESESDSESESESDYDNILLRITYKNHLHDDMKITKYITESTLVNDDYFVFPDLNEFNINKNGDFFNYLVNLNLNKYCCEILNRENQLFGNFIEKFGEIDLYDSIDEIGRKNKNTIWTKNTLEKFSSFMKHMSCAIHELHKIGVCHFDIKPENIRVDTLSKFPDGKFGKRFRLIDFGFAEQTPFMNQRKYGAGTPGYSPKIFDPKSTNWLPYSSPNDWIPINKKVTRLIDNDDGSQSAQLSYKSLHVIDNLYYDKEPLTEDENELFYKSDVYSLGRTFYHLLYFLNKNIQESEKGKIKYVLMNDIINNMVNPDINTRFSSKKMYIRIDMI